MLNTPCPTCGQPKNPNARQCKLCSNKTISDKMRGRKYSAERVERSEAGRQAAIASGKYRPFDIGRFTAGKPSHKASPVGSERVVKDGRVQVKCPDGRWRYRSRLVWAEAHGPLTSSDIIHHMNEDPMDDRLENLQKVTRAEHARLHATPEAMRERQAGAVEARKRNGRY